LEAGVEVLPHAGFCPIPKLAAGRVRGAR
jgi:hypothetical protein